MRPRSGAILAGMFLAATALRGQAPPLDAEFQANSYTTGRQYPNDVASDGHGNFVVIWNSYGQGGHPGVFGQRYDHSGASVGGEFPVNTYTSGGQFDPRVAMNASGAFVVVWWENTGEDGSGGGIFGQRFDAAGATVGAEFRVNTYTTGNQGHPDVAMDDSGKFVVVWDGDEHGGDNATDVFAQRFSAAAVKTGTEFQVNTYTTDDQENPAVAMDGAGNFVVVWTSANQLGSGDDVIMRSFAADGTPLSGEDSPESDANGDQYLPAIASNRRGDFVVAWSSNGQYRENGTPGVFLQQFNSGSERVGPELPANAYTSGHQDEPSVAVAPDGSFAVTWTSEGQDGSFTGIMGRRYDALGNSFAGEFPVNAYTTHFQLGSRIAFDGSGFVAVWSSGDSSGGPDGDHEGVFGRRQDVRAESLVADAHGIGTSDLNGVLEPGEAVVIEPHWRNRSLTTFPSLGGTASNFYGPPGGTYALLDGLADYGSVAPDALADCSGAASGPCYALVVGGTRPATHWDAILQEDLSKGGSQLWTLHLGDSFSDVPRSQPFYKKIETMLHKGITAGCNATQYCPGTIVSRDQMAIFIAKGIAGVAPLVPFSGSVSGQAYSCGNGGHSLFADVSPTDSFCKHVHYLAAQNVTLGCDATHYCPGQNITRDAMASFIAKAVVAPAGGSAVPISYTDPTTARSYSCVSGSPNLHFTDVPVSNAFCKHIHYLWARGIVDGCSATKYCPGSPVARDAMAKFIANGFGLKLYEP